MKWFEFGPNPSEGFNLEYVVSVEKKGDSKVIVNMIDGKTIETGPLIRYGGEDAYSVLSEQLKKLSEEQRK